MFGNAQETLKAFVDAIIPRSPGLAEEYGKIQYFGALDLHTYEYLIMTLSSYSIPLTNPLAVRFVMMGYYSEWSGYGSTRLEEPAQRRLEYNPLSWKQVGYPGPSLGYRALRK